MRLRLLLLTLLIGCTSTVPTGEIGALDRLREGNARYRSGSGARRAQLATGQHPYAIVFACSDSRVAPELVFNAALGDLFVIRTAGHVLDDASLGSIEFGVAELAIPTVVVMGHERCGAVHAALEAEHHAEVPGNIASLVAAVAPAIEQGETHPGDRLDNAVRANVALTVKRLRESTMLRDAIAAGKLEILGARYDLDTGEIEWLTAE